MADTTPTSPARHEVYTALVERMVALFDFEAEKITPQANLFTDLDLDSIDAIELAVQLQELTGRRVDEEALRGLRTVDDVVELVLRMRASS